MENGAKNNQSINLILNKYKYIHFEMKMREITGEKKIREDLPQILAKKQEARLDCIF